jgi:hypothetical protein
MRTSGRSAGRLGLVLFVALASVAAAAEICAVDVPAGDAYVVTAVLVPGCGGAEVCAGDKDEGHVDLRIGFGGDLSLSVNGLDAGTYDPAAGCLVTIECRKVCGQWLATTRVVNQTTGAAVYEQMNYRMPGAAEEVRAVAEDVIQLSAQ